METIKNFIKVFSLVIVVLAVLAGCRQAAASGFPDGTYAIDHYKLKFAGNHFTLMSEFDQEIAQGSFSIDGKRSSFTETDSAPECTAQQTLYSYEWAYDGKALTFSNPQDDCMSRTQLYMSQPWVKK